LRRAHQGALNVAPLLQPAQQSPFSIQLAFIDAKNIAARVGGFGEYVAQFFRFRRGLGGFPGWCFYRTPERLDPLQHGMIDRGCARQRQGGQQNGCGVLALPAHRATARRVDTQIARLVGIEKNLHKIRARRRPFYLCGDFVGLDFQMTDRIQISLGFLNFVRVIPANDILDAVRL
jgi:hypothetical protein